VQTRGTVEAFELAGDVATVRVRFRPAGAPVTLSYDRDAPDTVLIWGSPRHSVTESGAVVRVVDVEGGERG